MRTRTPGRRAVTAVEMAIVIGACLVLMFAIFEYGRYVMIRHLLDNAAREGARAAVISPTSLDPDEATDRVEERITEYLAGQVPDPQITLYQADAAGAEAGVWTDAPFGRNIVVEVSTSYSPMLPTFGFLPDPVRVEAKVMMRSEAN
jgi:Flp pilus assembly protein TadG